ncbi:ATP-grasp domain-containing protein [Streptomyces sp. SPB162]|uniref:ATP-grasp domain-containing protein n=1 Tax=Streptomyces sp. SPB162 TaxID=2940560 RepID=UPI0024064423|nr:ATP-grasp domain-containing protein [Streptomyces sp. SPB162]MDF9817060.1 biotin carboxylase [Streptomyces sp. SPB162]
MTRQVLLLNSDKPEVIAALARRPDLTVRVMTRKVYADLYRGLEVAYVDDFADLTQVEQAAYDLAAHGPLDHVVAATEKSVPAAGLVRSLLGVPGPGFGPSLWGAHKRAMKDRLLAAGLPVTDYAQAATVDDVPRAAEHTGWPVMIKPVFGAASKCTYRVDSPEEFGERHGAGDFADLADRRLPVQVERLVRFTHEYHCDGVVHAGEVARAAVSRYFLPPLRVAPHLKSGYVADQTDPFSREVLDLHRRVVAALGLPFGVTHLEVFRTGTGPVIGEVAIRPGGAGISRMWWHAFGVDLWEEFVRVSTGEPPSRPDRAPRPDTTGRSRLPALPGLRERVLALPGVLEVLTPEECASPGHLEAYFTCADETAAEAFIGRLHETAVPTV